MAAATKTACRTETLFCEEEEGTQKNVLRTFKYATFTEVIQTTRLLRLPPSAVSSIMDQDETGDWKGKHTHIEREFRWPSCTKIKQIVDTCAYQPANGLDIDRSTCRQVNRNGSIEDARRHVWPAAA